MNYDTSEYRATAGAVSMNALAAYSRGATGQGIRVGVIDSGIDLQSEEFGDCSGGAGTGTCRILASSRDTAGNANIDDVGGHGTAVAFTIAGRRNGAGTHGVAFDVSLIVLRADNPGSCATEVASDPDSGCKFNDNNIAAALDTARTNGARVVNISLGGGSTNGTLNTAMQRATAAGVILVQSAGNDGDSDPDPFTANASNAAISNGLIIIAGSVGESGTISSFSNRAGSGPRRNFYLAATGERVRAPDETNTPFLWSGTSFSAPQITGAVALLAQAFPAMTSAQIVDLLFTTAIDAGAPGIDDIYGRGILDLTRAFAPVGTTSIAGSSAVAASGVNGTLSAPMGDARQGALGTVVLDAYDRAFTMDMAGTINRDGPARQLPQLMASRQRGFSVGMKDMKLIVSLVPGYDAVRIDRLGIGTGDARPALAASASLSGSLTPRMQFAIGASESGNALASRLAGRGEPAFLIARDPANGSGFDVDVGASAALRQSFGSWGVTVSQEMGDVLTRRDTTLYALMHRPERFGYSRASLGVDRAIGGLRLGVTGTRLSEANSVLGARFSSGLGAARADSLFVDLGARYDAGNGWNFGASMRQGWTRATLRGGVDGSGALRTNGFAVDLGKWGVFDNSDQFGFRIAQPLRVASGGIDLNLPQMWDYWAGAVTEWRVQRINLAPDGREVDFELSYFRPFLGGDVSGNIFLRRNPGNFAAVPDDKGGAVRFSFGF